MLPGQLLPYVYAMDRRPPSSWIRCWSAAFNLTFYFNTALKEVRISSPGLWKLVVPNMIPELATDVDGDVIPDSFTTIRKGSLKNLLCFRLFEHGCALLIYGHPLRVSAHAGTKNVNVIVAFN